MNGDGQFVPVRVLYCTCTCQLCTVVGGWGRWVIIWFWQRLLAKYMPMLPFTTACVAGSRRVFRWCMDMPWSIGFVYMSLRVPRRSARAVSFFLMTIFLPLGWQAVTFISRPDGQSGTWSTAMMSYLIDICSALLSMPMSVKAWNECGSGDLKNSFLGGT